MAGFAAFAGMIPELVNVPFLIAEYNSAQKTQRLRKQLYEQEQVYKQKLSTRNKFLDNKAMQDKADMAEHKKYTMDEQYSVAKSGSDRQVATQKGNATNAAKNVMLGTNSLSGQMQKNEKQKSYLGLS